MWQNHGFHSSHLPVFHLEPEPTSQHKTSQLKNGTSLTINTSYKSNEKHEKVPKFNKNFSKKQLQNLYFFLYVKTIKQQNITRTVKHKT